MIVHPRLFPTDSEGVRISQVIQRLRRKGLASILMVQRFIKHATNLGLSSRAPNSFHRNNHADGFQHLNIEICKAPPQASGSSRYLQSNKGAPELLTGLVV